MASFQMLLFFFLYLIKYSQRNVCVTMIIFFFSLIFVLIFALCIHVSLLLGVWWFMMSIFFVNYTFYHYKYSPVSFKNKF